MMKFPWFLNNMCFFRFQEEFSSEKDRYSLRRGMPFRRWEKKGEILCDFLEFKFLLFIWMLTRKQWERNREDPIGMRPWRRLAIEWSRKRIKSGRIDFVRQQEWFCWKRTLSMRTYVVNSFFVLLKIRIWVSLLRKWTKITKRMNLSCYRIQWRWMILYAW